MKTPSGTPNPFYSGPDGRRRWQLRSATRKEFESEVAVALDKALAILLKEDVVDSLENLIKEVRRGIYPRSVPPAA